MSRWRNVSAFVHWWGAYFLYFFVMSAIGVAAVHMGTRLTKKVAASASKSSTQTSADARPRALSRVEQNAGLKVVVDFNATHSPGRTVVALVRPDIHPADLAAAIDRSELPQLKSAPGLIAVATCDLPACNSARVKGWRKALDAKHPSKNKALRLASHGGARNASNTRKLELASNKSVSPLAVVAAKKLPPQAKPSLFENSQGVRFADTPGDIIRLSLLNRS
jgi:hypothetical protein